VHRSLLVSTAHVGMQQQRTCRMLRQHTINAYTWEMGVKVRYVSSFTRC
jgi:hypothetical protein